MTRPRPTALEGELERRVASLLAILAGCVAVHLASSRLITLPACRGGFRCALDQRETSLPELPKI
ncbi:hypothetical protein MTsPCn3_18730 [Erythrobacter sp. MTPC3]